MARTRLMGVINVTPDSFSGDGLSYRLDLAAARARELARAGADIIDVGGESTRPGYHPISLGEELARVIPAVQAIAEVVSLPISVDTTKPEVARQAMAAGATIVNDVSGASPSMAREVARAGASLILVHGNFVPPDQDLLLTVAGDLRRQVAMAEAAGVRPELIMIDPGLGFGKRWRENFAIIRGLSQLHTLRKPVLVGPSRKAMIARVLSDEAGNRLEGTLALVALSVANGADLVRVHDVGAMKRAASVIDAILAAGGRGRA